MTRRVGEILAPAGTFSRRNLASRSDLANGLSYVTLSAGVTAGTALAVSPLQPRVFRTQSDRWEPLKARPRVACQEGAPLYDATLTLTRSRRFPRRHYITVWM